METDDSEYLDLSGIKQYQFCKRRWALIYIEQLWEENALTLEGHFMHERVHDSSCTESRGAVLLSRGMPVRSQTLKITGICDMVELHRSPDGIPIQGREGLWRVYPVEYKLGRPDSRGADDLQLCAQAMCLEEMFVTDIPEGAVYYGKLRSRHRVEITDELRAKVRSCVSEMYSLMRRGITPKVKPGKACANCSLYEKCQPGLMGKQSVKGYIRRAIEEEQT